MEFIYSVLSLNQRFRYNLWVRRRSFFLCVTSSLPIINIIINILYWLLLLLVIIDENSQRFCVDMVTQVDVEL